MAVLRKPFLSLARMVLWAHLYLPADDNFDLEQKELKIEDVSRHFKCDLAAAQSIVELILEHNDLSIDDIRPEPLEAFHWLSSIGQGSDWTDWRDPGTARVDIPDVTEKYLLWP